MRYDPSHKEFFMFVSDNDGEHRRLFCKEDGNDLVLHVDGYYGNKNKVILVDKSWDRKYIYHMDYFGHVPDLVSCFSGYMHVIGPVPTGSHSESSFDDED